MDKAILIIDMPDSCSTCPLFGGCYTDMCCRGMNNRGIDYPYPEDFRQDWCPLKPAPEKYDVDAAIENNPNYDPSYDVGRNDCIDEILGN